MRMKNLVFLTSMLLVFPLCSCGANNPSEYKVTFRENSAVTFGGPSFVERGSDYSFTVIPNDRHKYDYSKMTITCDAAPIQYKGNYKYLIESVQSNLVITANGITEFEDDPSNDLRINNPLKGGGLQIINEKVKEYLEATEESDIAYLLRSESNHIYDKQVGALSWNSLKGLGVNSYAFHISESPSFEDEYTFVSDETSIVPGFLIPGHHYYYKVEAIKNDAVFKTSEVDDFVALDDVSVRFLNIDYVNNVRDEGGWATESGKRVKYGLLYRGGALNRNNSNIVDEGKKTVNDILKWNSEIDLRTEGEDDIGLDGNPQTKNAFDEEKPYYKATIKQAMYIFPGWSQSEPARSYFAQTEESLNMIFDCLSNTLNYPVYFHCNAGADRTGTLAYLLLGYLGVGIDDLYRDFELTSFTTFGQRWRSQITSDNKFDPSGVMQDGGGNFVAMGKTHQYMMEHYGTEDGKASSAIENYLVSAMHIDQSKLDSFKTIMLGE